MNPYEEWPRLVVSSPAEPAPATSVALLPSIWIFRLFSAVERLFALRLMRGLHLRT